MIGSIDPAARIQRRDPTMQSVKPNPARAFILASIFSVLTIGCAPKKTDMKPSVDFRHGDLKVSQNRRFLVHSDGTPFFYLGDTAWELFHRLNREEAEKYLENRRRKRFTVIQAVALAELDGIRTPNAYGDRPLIDEDPARPAVTPGSDPSDSAAYDYWDHVDWIVDKAAEKGITIGLLPAWGDKLLPLKWGRGPAVFNAKNAEAYGNFLGERFKDRPNIIWILGGDRPPENEGRDYRPVWRAMAEGIRSRDARHLMTYHPWGEHSSSEWLHSESWLDFNMIQSGHRTRDMHNDDWVSVDYKLEPAKPTFDGEPAYEDHAVNWDPKNGWFDDSDVRRGAYWALFAGAMGHTYGCHPVWQMFDRGREPITGARHFWWQVLDLPGAFQMAHVRSLMESRPMLERIPDQGLISGDPGTGSDHLRAARGANYAFVYVPTGKPVKIRMGRISGERVRASWYDPRTGKFKKIGTFANADVREFTPPGKTGAGNDWVLVMDDASEK
jgi:hypothetical protein